MKKLKVGSEDVELDEKILDFTPENINDFLTKYASLHRFYQNKHNEAVFIARSLNDQHGSMYNSKFREYKAGNGYSDKMAEACAKSDEDCNALLAKVRQAEYVKDELYGFLRSMDYAHDNAKELCYNLRKELDKIYPKYVMSTEPSYTKNSSNEDRAKMEDKLKSIYNKDLES